MNIENLGSVAQLMEAMWLASKELEKALQKNDYERFRKSKEEILKFQKQISEILV